MTICVFVGRSKKANMWYNTPILNRKVTGAMLEASSGLGNCVGGATTMNHSTIEPHFPENLEDYAPWVAEHGLRAPYGKCQCGCELDTNIATQTCIRDGYRAGQPKRYRNGHASIHFRCLPRDLVLPSGTRAIPLTHGKYTIVDEADYEYLSRFAWAATKDGNTWYATRSNTADDGGPKVFRMHRVIMGARDEIHVDHIDRDGLNNSKSNLRLATSLQNSLNSASRRSTTSRFKGVYWNKEMRKWHAQIKLGKKRLHLGFFDDEADAAKQRDMAARQLHGDFAWLNFPTE